MKSRFRLVLQLETTNSTILSILDAKIKFNFNADKRFKAKEILYISILFRNQFDTESGIIIIFIELKSSD